MGIPEARLSSQDAEFIQFLINQYLAGDDSAEEWLDTLYQSNQTHKLLQPDILADFIRKPPTRKRGRKESKLTCLLIHYEVTQHTEAGLSLRQAFKEIGNKYHTSPENIRN